MSLQYKSRIDGFGIRAEVHAVEGGYTVTLIDTDDGERIPFATVYETLEFATLQAELLLKPCEV